MTAIGRGSRIIVLGDVALDVWSSGRVERLCREGPAPVVDVLADQRSPGAAGNTAANLAALGAEVVLVSTVGDDEDGRTLLRSLADAGVDVSRVISLSGRRTVSKRRVIADDQLLARVDEGSRAPVGDAVSDEVCAYLATVLEPEAAVVVCDYGFGTLTDRVRNAVLAYRDRMPLLVVDAREPSRWAPARADVTTPNAAEAWALLHDMPPASAEARLADLETRRRELLAATGAGAVVVTLDRDGSVVVTADQPLHRTWAGSAVSAGLPRQRDTAGAGDTYCAALTLGLRAGLALPDAAELAQAAADVVVHRPGTAVCSAQDLRRRVEAQHDVVLESGALAAAVQAHRAAGRRIVFTNGCFDVLHRGHVAYLNQAKRLGDVLVVAVNSDASVARLKGPSRPVTPAADRAALVAALSCVDYVTIFADDTPTDLLRRLTPEIYVKGGDYTADMLPEAPVVRAYGGQVMTVDYLDDHSTSALLTRMRVIAEARS